MQGVDRVTFIEEFSLNGQSVSFNLNFCVVKSNLQIYSFIMDSGIKFESSSININFFERFFYVTKKFTILKTDNQ